MPSFYVLAVFAAILLFSAPVLADSSEASQIQANIEELAEKSAQMQGNAQGLAIVGQGAGLDALEDVLEGINDFVNTTNTDINALQGAQNITDDTDASGIASGCGDLATTHESTISFLTDTVGVFGKVPNMTDAFQSDKDALDNLFSLLVTLVPSESANLTAQITAMDTALDAAIKAYSAANTSAKAKRIL